MKITFYGSAKEVTGACHLVEANGYKILLECGSFQGGYESEKRNEQPFPFKPSEVDAVILSHAHLDHSGRIPKLVKDGFRGPIYAQQATVDVAEIILKDAGFLNEKDAKWENRHQRDRKKHVEPLYTAEEAEIALQQFEGFAYGVIHEPFPGIRFRFRDAGHILGSSIVELWLSEGAHATKIVFSGDLGHSGAPILQEPEVVEEADLVMLESTYGDRNHRSWEATWEELGQVLTQANQERGNILIPAFAIGRTQELLYVLKQHYEDWGLAHWQIFLDSPMAIRATETYQAHRELYDTEALAVDEHPFSLPNLRVCRTTEESMALNMVRSGAIIIAGSGMCSGGRIRHHLKQHVEHSGTHLIMIGFQAKGTLGRKLVDGAQTIQLWGKPYEVRAKIHTINGLSAHADQEHLMAWYGQFNHTPPVVLVHGEEEALTSLATQLRQTYHAPITIPQYGESLEWAMTKASPGYPTLKGNAAGLRSRKKRTKCS